MHRARAGLPALLAIAVLAVLGCGGGGDHRAARDAPKPPPLTVPRTSPSTGAEPAPPPTTTATTPAPAPPTSTSGAQPGPPSSTPQDSPQHDVQPPKGSPAERFERFCRENPGACD